MILPPGITPGLNEEETKEFLRRIKQDLKKPVKLESPLKVELIGGEQKNEGDKSMHTLKTKDGKYAIRYDYGFEGNLEIVECGTDKTFTIPAEALLFFVGEGYVKPFLKRSIDISDAIKILT